MGIVSEQTNIRFKKEIKEVYEKSGIKTTIGITDECMYADFGNKDDLVFAVAIEAFDDELSPEEMVDRISSQIAQYAHEMVFHFGRVGNTPFSEIEVGTAKYRGHHLAANRSDKYTPFGL